MSAPIPHTAFDAGRRAAATVATVAAARAVHPVAPAPTQGEAIGFIAGTRIATPMGYVAVELLGAGDRVLTADGRHARLTWVGMTQIAATGAHAPVRFATGVLDNIRPLRLGQGHRVRVSGWRAELLFDAEAVLASAKSFVDGADVEIEESAEVVTYIHLMFDAHEIVLAENVACETLLPGPEGLRDLDAMARDAALSQRPALSCGYAGGRAALPVLSGIEEILLRAA